MKELMFKLHNEEDGATATEYIILLILIACVAIAVVKTFGESLSGRFEAADTAVGGLTFPGEGQSD